MKHHVTKNTARENRRINKKLFKRRKKDRDNARLKEYDPEKTYEIPTIGDLLR